MTPLENDEKFGDRYLIRKLSTCPHILCVKSSFDPGKTPEN
jgi:hypothetical protein